MNDKLLSRLTLDSPGTAVSTIIKFLRKKVTEEGMEGIALGLSGGIDSAVMATLAAKTLRPSQIHALYMPDRISPNENQRKVKRLSNELGLNLQVVDITDQVKEEGAYDWIIFKIATFSPRLNRLLFYFGNTICLKTFGQPLYALALKSSEVNYKGWKQSIFNNVVAPAKKSYYLRHRKRREILDRYASQRDLIPIGAANRSECLLGWFVPGGIDDLRIQPLLDLYKTQIRQMARFLDLPGEIIESAPSPDMYRGVSDELSIGFSYKKIDKVLYALDHDLSLEQVSEANIKVDDYESIKDLVQISAYLRGEEHEYPEI